MTHLFLVSMIDSISGVDTLWVLLGAMLVYDTFVFSFDDRQYQRRGYAVGVIGSNARVLDAARLRLGGGRHDALEEYGEHPDEEFLRLYVWKCAVLDYRLLADVWY